MNQHIEFDYSNLVGRPAGLLVRVGSVLVPGVRKVQNQVVPYAEAWQKHNKAAVKERGPLWVVIGDSMSQGIGASSYLHGWVSQLNTILKAHGMNFRIVNLSASGARLSDVLERQLPAMESLNVKPDMVTVMIGSNDLISKKYRVDAPAKFDTLLERLPKGAIVSNLMGGGVAGILDQKIKTAADAGAIVLANMRSHGPGSWRDKVAEDRFHPNDAGYAAISYVFAKAMNLA